MAGIMRTTGKNGEISDLHWFLFGCNDSPSNRMDDAMTEFERNMAGEIMAWAFFNESMTFFNESIPMSNEDGSLITTQQLTEMYWGEYFNTCEMASPETGMEVF